MKKLLFIIPLMVLFSTTGYTQETTIDSLAKNPLIEGPENKVNAKAEIIAGSSTSTRKTIVVTFVIDEGWHLNTNPATLEDLIPTSIETKTEIPSELKVIYPPGKEFESPLGPIKVYEGTVHATATIEAKEPLDASQIEVFATVQPCKASICYPPTKLTVPLVQSK